MERSHQLLSLFFQFLPPLHAFLRRDKYNQILDDVIYHSHLTFSCLIFISSLIRREEIIFIRRTNDVILAESSIVVVFTNAEDL